MTHERDRTGILADRYGSRGQRRGRPWLRWLLALLAGLAVTAVTVVGFNNLGNPPLQGKQTAFSVLDDHTLRITVEVRRDAPQRPAECVVRARDEPGTEVGRREMLIPPSDGTVRYDTTLHTTNRAVMGEVYGCTYNVPEYLSTPTRPTG